MSMRDDLAQLLVKRAGGHIQMLDSGPEENAHSVSIGLSMNWAAIADIILAAGWRPPARVTTTAAELDNLPGESVVIDSDGSAWRKGSDYRDIPRWWLAGAPGGGVGSSIVINHAPVTVVYTPEES